MKRIVLNKRQISEVIGVDFNFLDSDNGNFKEFNGNNEITTNDSMNDFSDIDPITTDEYGKMIAPRTFYGSRNTTRGNIFCSNDSKGNIVESNKNLENKSFFMPDEIYNFLVSINNNNSLDAKGKKRLQNLINNRNVSYNEMYQLKNYMSNIDKKSSEYNIIGGDRLKNWVDSVLNKAVTLDKTIKQDKKDMGDENAFIKSHEKNNGGKAHSEKNNVSFSYN